MKKNGFIMAALLSIFLLTSCSGISQSQYDNVTAQLDAAKEQAQALINSNAATQAAIQAFQAANATVQAQIQALQNANVSAQTIIQGLQNEKAAAQAQIQTLQNALPGFLITSSAFKTGETMPVKYSQQGDNVSPPLSWNTAPNGTQAFALLAEDIDGPATLPIITHWIIFNIPPTARSLPEAVPVSDQLPDGSIQGSNIRGARGYIGPSPPVGTTHRYQFTLFALDQKLTLNAGASRNETITAMQGHILGVAQTMAIYKRP
ncbi:MAG: YbhB/YbcL family Raf kinase inhibitor-like protein [Dehalococcoidales bacterium]|nr:YbhB/YbcL family Raf kinase inhibitor-like protein [Dehalococcoidales bacterium]